MSDNTASAQAGPSNQPTTSRATRRTSTVSIQEPEPDANDGDDDTDAEADLEPNDTPRGRKTDRESDKIKLPSPRDDIFKSSFWPSMPIGITSLESQITNVKLDMIMAYLQDIRSENSK